jgi:CHAT domain-containing protein
MLAVGCVLTVSAAPRPQAPAAPSTVDRAVVERALAAADDIAREALVTAHPEIAVEPMRGAIVAAAAVRIKEGFLPSAVNAHRSLLLAATRMADTRGRMLALNLIGQFAGRAGDLTTAEPALLEALRMAEAAKDIDIQISASNNLGIVQRLQGKYDEAIASYRRTLAVAEAAGRRDSVARSLNNLGVVAQQQGDLRGALEYVMRSMVIKEELGEEVATTYGNIGNIHHRQRHFSLALDYYERSRAEAERTRDRRPMMSAISNIGHVHMLEGRYVQARAALNQALAVAESAGDRGMMSTALHNLASVAKREGKLTEAADVYGRSLDISEASGDKPGMVESLAGLAEVLILQGRSEQALATAARSAEVARSIGQAQELWGALTVAGQANVALGRGAAAVQAFEEAIEVIERIRQQVAGGTQDLLRFFGDKSEPYYGLAAVHAASGRMAEAFSATERARARVLLDLIESSSPSATAPDRDTTIATFAEAATVVPPGTTIAMFMSDVERTQLLLLTRASAQAAPALQVFTIPLSRADLTTRVEAFTRQLSRRDLGFGAAGRALFDALLGQVDPRLRSGERLVIVPDGPLWNLPFQALITPRGRFLIEEQAIGYSHSVTALQRLQERRRSRQGREERLVAIGDPQFGTGDARSRLPEAAREARAIAAMYGAASQVFLGPEATEAQLRAASPGATVLHVATHGELVPASPMYSFVSLAGTGDGTKAGDDRSRDGRLEAREIANMTLDADLVVLSACETALGSDGGGEGVVGLSWSLFAAGASAAVVSQWRVDSASTTELMLGFHRALRTEGSGGSSAQAMQTAARALIASAQYRHPFYWAGFVVIGAP